MLINYILKTRTSSHIQAPIRTLAAHFETSEDGLEKIDWSPK